MEEWEDIGKWLGITHQQLNIMEALLHLQRSNEDTSPKSIIQTDANLRKGAKIQKSNFFAQLKNLRNRGYVKKQGEASYAVDFDAIHHALDLAQYRADEERTELKKAREETERYFKSMIVPDKPIVSFLESDQTYGRIAEMMRTCSHFMCTGIFPRILYAHSLSLIHRPGTQKYAQIMWERCIKDREMEATYLTNFDIPYLFQKLLIDYNNPTLVYEEIRSILNGLESLLEQNPLLNIIYIDSPSGLDAMIPYSKDSTEFFLITRDESKNIIGSVYLNSPDLLVRFKKLFDTECLKGIDMRDKKAKPLFPKLEKQLERIYSKHNPKNSKKTRQ
jgi:hypothetical protein